MFHKSGYLTVVACLFSLYCFTQDGFTPCTDKRIAYEGRIPFTEEAATLLWPGTSVRINFTGSGISGVFKDSDTSNYYNVIVDDKYIYKLHFGTEKRIYVLAKELAPGLHSLQLFKRTEWDKGRTWFYGFVCPMTTELRDPPPSPRRKIEFYGNSISCGYAIEDAVHDNSIGYYENNYDAYPAITARHFKAQYQCIAKSGIGIAISWFPLIMPEMYDRLDPEDSTSKWDFSRYTPDLVVINLLQNDSWLVNMPNNPQFKSRFGSTAPGEDFYVQAYKAFVQSIRDKYPSASIICMLGNMDITRKGSPWAGYVEKAVSLLHDAGISVYVAPYKETPGHPKTAEQKLLAEGLIRYIDEHIKW
ncbi:MAG TPA: GDSL-type esterase/lipase family protein [Chitinophagaceae bacterium]|jgi:hypothetical protein